jgi:hypothetical protein
MKKTYLIAGSLGLLGFAAQAVPANAADGLVNKASTSEVSTVAENAADQPLLLAEQPATTSVSDLIEDTDSDSVGQVTSVSQLSDVQPTDWAFQALQSLVERYGCIAGYPNGTFRGNRSATRYEMAAALNACLDQISDRFASKADLDAVKALQDEFAAELATLRGRVDGLEARVDTVEAQQFSTTTKLQGEAVLAAQFGDVVTGTDTNANSRASALSRVRLNFNTSFSGDDLLQTQLEVGNGGQDFFTAAGINGNPALPANGLGGQIDLGASDFANIDSDVSLRRLAYSFKPVGDDITLTVGTNIFPSDFIDFNSYANNSAQDFASGFFINNPLIINDGVDFGGGAGAAFDWNINGGPLSVRGVYVAANGDSATALGDGGGLGFGNHQASAEVELANSFGADDANSYAVRLQGTFSEVNSIQQQVVGVNAELSFGRFGVFGRYGASIDPQNEAVAVNQDLFGGNNLVQSYQAGVGVKDLFVPGSLLAAAFGQPFLDPSVANGGAPFTQFNVESFYRVPVNDNITITPSVQYIGNPGGVTGADIIQGLVRATFSF